MSADTVSPDEPPVIKPLSTDAEAWACAELMTSADPWRRLGRTLEQSYTPNVFICASSFNPAAQRLYERLGYTVVGELTDYIARGHSEILLRKTTGPLNESVDGSR